MTDDSLTDECVLEGIGATPLSGVGTVHWYGDGGVELSPAPAPDEVDSGAERSRFEVAVEETDEALVAARDQAAEDVGEEEAEVFEAHREFLADPQIATAVESSIEDGLPAPHAVRDAFDEQITTFESMDGMVAERADDLRDVRDRLLRALTGVEGRDIATLPDGAVVFAERLTPSDTARLDPERIAGFATVAGGRTSHAAIMARSLGIPAVVGIGDALTEVEDGTTVVVAAEEDQVIVDPSEDRRRRAQRGRAVEVRSEPVTTADGHAVEVAANVGTAGEVPGAVDRGADGVGLFRTEFFFVDRDQPPTEDEQYEAFVEALSAFEERAGPGRLVVRTLDIGGDKPVPYLDLDPGRNPFLGVRGIRLSLSDEYELFETQVRALLRAAGTEGGDRLSIMFPLVATVDELDAALERVDAIATDLEADGVEHAVPELGVMIETPASVLLADELASRVDFLSIGTNDLTQYTMAASREDDAVTHLHDPLQPAVLRAINRTVEAAHRNDAWIGMCGEMAGDPRFTELLVALGLDELSMSAVTIPDVKARIADLTVDEARNVADRVLHAETAGAVRDVLDLE